MPNYLLADEQCEHYQRDGYVIVRDLLNPSLIKALLKRVKGMLGGRYPSDGFICGPFSHKGKKNNGRFIKQIKPNRFPINDPVLARFSANAAIRRLASQLMETDDAKVVQQHAIVRESKARETTPWYQDDFYWQLGEHDLTAITAWVPLLPTSVKNGTIWIIPSSHDRGLLPHQPIDQGISRRHAVEEDIDASDAIPLDLRPGDVSFYHPNLIHGAKAPKARRRQVYLYQYYRGIL